MLVLRERLINQTTTKYQFWDALLQAIFQQTNIIHVFYNRLLSVCESVCENDFGILC